MRAASDSFTANHGRSPSVPDLVEQLGYTADEIIEALDVQTAYRPASLDTPTGGREDGATTVGATIASEQSDIEEAEMTMAVQELLTTLAERERRIVELRFFDELSQSEIAEQVGVSQMHVSRLLRTSLEQLREQLR